MLTGILKAKHYVVGEARNGTEACVKLGRDRPDLLILDIHMPNMDGVEVCRVIKQTKELSGIKVIVVTGFSGSPKVKEIANSCEPVLIIGETRVGKELMAKAVHTVSKRQGRFVSINVAGIDDNAFSDTLFGHAKGAFTGADQIRKGLIEEASNALGKAKPACPEELITLLSNYAFPGNIRELRAMVFDAVGRHKSGILSMERFGLQIEKEHAHPGDDGRPGGLAGDLLLPEGCKLPTLREATRILIAEAIKRAENNQSMAATFLGISRQRLAKHLKENLNEST